MQDFANNVTKLCIQKYNSLKKTGKPTNNEWTVLSGIIINDEHGSLTLVSLATGTKCLGESELMNTELHKVGSKLSDSHAEVLARRAFLRYLYDQLDLTFSFGKSKVFFLNTEKKIEIIDGVSFHFFSSQVPCGDCSIFPKIDVSESTEPIPKIRKTTDYIGNDERKISIDEEIGNRVKDIYRTGAKCVKNQKKQDLYLPGVNYHVLGLLRTKPGRGDPTLSLSCSDKIAKWNILGIQGSLLLFFLPQIKIQSIIIGGECPFSLEAMERGVYKRFANVKSGPIVLQSDIGFEHRKGIMRIRPCPTSIIWSAVQERDYEVAVDGLRQGATKKKPNAYLNVSRRALFRSFLKICEKYDSTCFQIKHPKKITYYDCKQFSKYQKLWNEAKLGIFHVWPSKPEHLQKFTL